MMAENSMGDRRVPFVFWAPVNTDAITSGMYSPFPLQTNHNAQLPTVVLKNS